MLESKAGGGDFAKTLERLLVDAEVSFWKFPCSNHVLSLVKFIC